MRRSSKLWQLSIAVMVFAGCSHPSTSGSPSVRAVAEAPDPVIMLRNYLQGRILMARQAPVLMVCDTALASTVTASVQERLLSASLVDSIIVSPTCSGYSGEIRNGSFRPILRITRFVAQPGDSSGIYARATMSFGSYHLERAKLGPSGIQIILSDFIQN